MKKPEEAMYGPTQPIPAGSTEDMLIKKVTKRSSVIGADDSRKKVDFASVQAASDSDYARATAKGKPAKPKGTTRYVAGRGVGIAKGRVGRTPGN